MKLEIGDLIYSGDDYAVIITAVNQVRTAVRVMGAQYYQRGRFDTASWYSVAVIYARARGDILVKAIK